MPVLPRFDTPGRLPEPTDADRDAWSARLHDIFELVNEGRTQLYDPTVEDTPNSAQQVPITWAAFPATLLRDATSEQGRWTAADAARKVQDEYCEWGVERNADQEITRVTFTTEVPEYFHHLAERDPNRLLAFYHEFVDGDATLDRLIVDKQYQTRNPWNATTTGRPAHLQQDSNNLEAAVKLVSDATVQRTHDDQLVTSKEALTICVGGEPFRNSDPQIAVIVNEAARGGAKLTFADPPGLYLNGISTAGMVTEDGTDPAEFWTIERGAPGFAVRASFAVPEALEYTVSDIKIRDRNITFGAQLADRVQVRVTALAHPADIEPLSEDCP